MSAHSGHEQRDISHSHFRDRNFINQGNVQGNIYYGLPHPPARAEVVRVIPYPRNEDLVHRGDLIDRLDKLLPPTLGSHSAALWGLGGSGKTQIALDYAYRRCDADDECGVFWVHADNEATFLADYKTIGKKLGVDERLDGPDLLDAVRDGIEAQRKWLMVFDNADDLKLFGGRYYGRVEMRTSPVHLSDRAKVLSVLETWRISTERIRVESEMSYRILHVIAYVDSQDIPQELIAAATGQYDTDDKSLPMQVTELEVLEAVTRWKEFSFLSLRQSEDGERSYEMHKLVQEAVRYGLGVRGPMQTTVGKAPRAESGPSEPENGEAYYSGIALQVVDGLFPSSEPTSWAQCEQYVTHAIRVAEWAEVSGTEIDTVTLLARVSYFLYERGRWREKEPVDSRAWGLRRKVLGEKHPDTISSMASLATTYHGQGRYDEAKRFKDEALALRREVLGEKHPDTIRSMAGLAATYHAQGQYDEAEEIVVKVLDLRREVLGEKHPDTIRSMAGLATTYHQQGRYDEAERLEDKVLELRREVLGEKHPDTISSMADLATTYHQQGRYDEAEEIAIKVLDLRREVLGEKHPDTIRSMAGLATTYHQQGRYDEAEEIVIKVLDLRREVLGEKHPDTIRSMAGLATTYHQQGRADMTRLRD
ncbi:NB-ARC domain-containing protein [Fusarium keratoplasticum]|nr:NB-ARC domain-containing protein [Fusarium keratoplasticum]